MVTRDQGWIAEYNRLISDFDYLRKLGENADFTLETIVLDKKTEGSSPDTILYVKLGQGFGRNFTEEDGIFPKCDSYRDALRRVLDHYKIIKNRNEYSGIILDLSEVGNNSLVNDMIETVGYQWLVLFKNHSTYLKLVTPKNSKIGRELEKVLGSIGLNTYRTREDALKSYI